MERALAAVLLLAAVTLLTGQAPAPTQAGPFEEGVAAFDQGRFATAFKLWLPLAQQGHAAAQFNIGYLYEQGRGVTADLAEAARWYLKAAHQGDPDAQYKVAVMYETGAGLPQDLEEARRWYVAVVANPRAAEASSTTRDRARQRLAQLSGTVKEVVAYDGGQFVVVRSPDGACVIALQGVVSRDAAFKFDDIMRKAGKSGCGRPWVLLESPGGLLDEGIRIGRDVHMRSLRTVTRDECASACAIIFLGGTERVLAGPRARIGLHQPATVRSAATDRWCSGSMDSNGVHAMRSYLGWAIPEAAAQVMDIVMHTACDAIAWTYGQRAVELGIATRLEPARGGNLER